jgi:inner membrane protein
MDEATMWGVAGLLLIIADVVLGTFFMLFLGGGALLTAVLVLSGITEPAVEWMSFALFSALGVLLFRKKLLSSFGPSRNNRYVEHVGQKVVVVQEIPAGGIGRVVYRGSEWPAKSVDGSTLAEHAGAIIQNTDGIMLLVKGE